MRDRESTEKDYPLSITDLNPSAAEVPGIVGRCSVAQRKKEKKMVDLPQGLTPSRSDVPSHSSELEAHAVQLLTSRYQHTIEAVYLGMNPVC